jgi:hypothetical protein
MMSDFERLQSAEQRVLLCLTDLGHLGDSTDGEPSLVPSPVRARSEVVLLLPWSLLSTVAELDVVARTTTRQISSSYAPEDWLTAWHHFVDGEDWGPLALDDDATKRAAILRKLPFTGLRHFILAASVMANLATADSRPVALQGLVSAGRQGYLTREGECESAVDPLVFTNPGSAPEGLSPLFRVPLSGQPT